MGDSLCPSHPFPTSGECEIPCCPAAPLASTLSPPTPRLAPHTAVRFSGLVTADSRHSDSPFSLAIKKLKIEHKGALQGVVGVCGG